MMLRVQVAMAAQRRLLVTSRVVLHDVHPDNYHVFDVMGRG